MLYIKTQISFYNIPILDIYPYKIDGLLQSFPSHPSKGSIAAISSHSPFNRYILIPPFPAGRA